MTTTHSLSWCCRKYILAACVFVFTGLPADTRAEDQTAPVTLLRDVNGDGAVTIAAFGDSITRGVGDFISSSERIGEDVPHPQGEAGYPLRIEQSLHVPVANYGNPGERVSTDGLYRFARLIPHSGADFVVISGGTNDIVDEIGPNQFGRSMQTMVNIARASGIEPILAANPPACCNHAFFNGAISSYNEQLQTIAAANSIPYSDFNKAFTNTCNIGNCDLLIRPEGHHPDEKGYDVMGEAIIATLFQINLFAPDGPALLEQAAGLPAGSVQTKPDPVSVPQ